MHLFLKLDTMKTIYYGIVLRANVPINLSITLDRMINKHEFLCERELHNQADNLVGRENA